jgi:hypothetical protein
MALSTKTNCPGSDLGRKPFAESGAQVGIGLNRDHLATAFEIDLGIIAIVGADVEDETILHQWIPQKGNAFRALMGARQAVTLLVS